MDWRVSKATRSPESTWSRDHQEHTDALLAEDTKLLLTFHYCSSKHLFGWQQDLLENTESRVQSTGRVCHHTSRKRIKQHDDAVLVKIPGLIGPDVLIRLDQSGFSQ